MNSVDELHCTNCNTVVEDSDLKMVCDDCSHPLSIKYNLNEMEKALKLKKRVSTSESFLEYWKDILPLKKPELINKISLGETTTPLVRASYLGGNLGVPDLRFKMEMGPTLSLKDRGTALCTLKAVEFGYDMLCVASSGNNAASIAAYAAKAGLPAVVFIQKDTSPAKVSKCVVYGARVVRVDGDMSVASKLCGEMLTRHRWFQAGGPNPYRLSAKRTAVYEIINQMGNNVPDAIFIPCGGSAGMVAAYNGLSEMVEMGIIPTMPKLIGVQLAACDPITRAFVEQRDIVTPIEKKPSFSDALMNNNPYWGNQALQAVRKSGGFFISVSDQEVVDTIRLLGAKEGLFVEPAGAVSAAGLRKAMSENRLSGLHRAVCVLTGHGLNAPQAIFDSQELPAVVAPEIEAVETYLQL